MAICWFWLRMTLNVAVSGLLFPFDRKMGVRNERPPETKGQSWKQHLLGVQRKKNDKKKDIKTRAKKEKKKTKKRTQEIETKGGKDLDMF